MWRSQPSGELSPSQSPKQGTPVAKLDVNNKLFALPCRFAVAPSLYFRMLIVALHEEIGGQRGLAWRCADSLAIREFLGVPLTQGAPCDSSLTRISRPLPRSVHRAVLQSVLDIAAVGACGPSGAALPVGMAPLTQPNISVGRIENEVLPEAWLKRVVEPAGELVVF